MKRPLSDPYWFYNFFILCYLATPYFKLLRVFHYSNKPSISQSSSLFNHQHSRFFFFFWGNILHKEICPLAQCVSYVRMEHVRMENTQPQDTGAELPHLHNSASCFEWFTCNSGKVQNAHVMVLGMACI